ncbi:helix-turn-helix domain-containing protein [bacterium]|nr:helix-turn-helix domain-containing protein [bacterium]MBU1677095.1 helix-turn-helix domain-containing protein [bacterium]
MSADRPVYQTPGAMIRAARTARRLSLSDLAAETRIPDRLLSAIENDDYDQLSGALYARSFLRTCGQSLGLDPSLLIDSYERLLTEQEPEIPADQTWEEEAQIQRIGGLPWRKILVIGTALAAVALVVWLVQRSNGDDATPRGDAVESEARLQAPGEAGAAGSAAGDSTGPVGSDVLPGDGEGPSASAEAPAGAATGVPAQGGDPRGVDTIPGTTAGEAPPPSDVLTALGSLPRGDLSLVFDDGESWPLVLCVVTDRRLGFAVGSDGDREARDVAWPARPAQGVPQEGVVAGRLYEVGGRYVAYWGAADHFLLKLTRADGVTVVLNGTPLAIPARSVGREWVLDRSQLGP